jgi:hypothetical protein
LSDAQDTFAFDGLWDSKFGLTENYSGDRKFGTKNQKDHQNHEHLGVGSKNNVKLLGTISDLK